MLKKDEFIKVLNKAVPPDNVARKALGGLLIHLFDTDNQLRGQVTALAKNLAVVAKDVGEMKTAGIGAPADTEESAAEEGSEAEEAAAAEAMAAAQAGGGGGGGPVGDVVDGSPLPADILQAMADAEKAQAAQAEQAAKAKKPAGDAAQPSGTK